MPLLRHAVHEFRDDWNLHQIRKQKNRPHVVTGDIVEEIYNHPPSGEKFGIPVDAETIQELGREVSDWDMDAYLPAETLAWCEEAIERLEEGVARPTREYLKPVEERRHCLLYLELCALAVAHAYSGAAPILELCEKPLAAMRWG